MSATDSGDRSMFRGPAGSMAGRMISIPRACMSLGAKLAVSKMMAS
jgi:hypothetical protein